MRRPVVTLGLWASGRCANGHVLPYILAQIVGAVGATGIARVRGPEAGRARRGPPEGGIKPRTGRIFSVS
ncbi:hypothetical protein [Methylobacterium sp. J-070]|uniref:hypothetical protein n=1 Tax=Methylobacterium sp. J-070 TaxID=2836650 RepID=UPI00391B52B1